MNKHESVCQTASQESCSASSVTTMADNYADNDNEDSSVKPRNENVEGGEINDVNKENLGEDGEEESEEGCVIS